MYKIEVEEMWIGNEEWRIIVGGFNCVNKKSIEELIRDKFGERNTLLWEFKPSRPFAEAEFVVWIIIDWSSL